MSQDYRRITYIKPLIGVIITNDQTFLDSDGRVLNKIAARYGEQPTLQTLPRKTLARCRRLVRGL